MVKWIVQRLECNTATPLVGKTNCIITMSDVDTPGSVKYEIRSFNTDDVKSNPNLILETLQADGFTPNDFGLGV